MVALKILDARRSPTADFLRELSTTLALNHPNLVQVYGVEHQPHQRHLLLDYCEGGTLRQLLDTEPRPKRMVLLQLIIHLLAGLHHVHSRGIVHCDVKPENILLTLTPEGWCPKLTDFGIAHNQALPPTKTLGSPAYMAPEYFDGHISPAVDIYAVGIILYEMMVGYRPFQGPPDQLRAVHHTQALPGSASIPPALWPILERALAKHPRERFHSSEQLAQALTTASEQIDRSTSREGYRARPYDRVSLFEPWSLAEQSLPPSTHPPPPSLVPEVIALAPDRSWGARLEASKGLFYCLRKGQWSSPHALPRALSNPPKTRDAKQQHERLPQALRKTQTEPKILILDGRHGVIWSSSPGQTQLTLFNRRGHSLAPIMLSTEITQIFPSHHPLQMLALEKHAPQVLLKISLHPFCVQRIPLAIAPSAGLSLPWAIALADSEGRLFLIDHAGNGLGLVASPFQDFNTEISVKETQPVEMKGKLTQSEKYLPKQSNIQLFAVNQWELAIEMTSTSPHQPNHIQQICLKDLELELIF